MLFSVRIGVRVHLHAVAATGQLVLFLLRGFRHSLILLFLGIEITAAQTFCLSAAPEDGTIEIGF